MSPQSPSSSTRRVELTIDVTSAFGVGDPAWIAATVELPDPAQLGPNPIVCFAKPGGGYTKGYYTEELPGPARGAQSRWHAERGWIFVSIDPIGTGASSVDHDSDKLDFTNTAATSRAAEREIASRLTAGTLADDFPAVRDPIVIGIGHSRGGSLTLIQQGRFHEYDGIGILGHSAVHTRIPSPPGRPPVVFPWIPRDIAPASGQRLNPPSNDSVERQPGQPDMDEAMRWAFHFDDVATEVVNLDLGEPGGRIGERPVWRSAPKPTTVSHWAMTPGAVAPEAAAVTCPVLIAVGERDVIADPKGDLRAYLSARSIDLFICPRMAHMHNFASTRELMWHRIEQWAEWVRACRSAERVAGRRDVAFDAEPIG